MTDPPVDSLLQRFEFAAAPRKIISLGNAGGFSGASLWRIVGADETTDYCLRRWPAAHPSPARLSWIHRIVLHAYQSGLRELAAPIADRHGGTIVDHAGFQWELSRWMPGRADYAFRPTPLRLADALRWLARFHQATARSDSRMGRPPGIDSRLRLWNSIFTLPAERWYARLDSRIWPDGVSTCRAIVARSYACAQPVRHLLNSVAGLQLPIQPCLRDIWHDHVLFSDDRVTGVVDFGALDLDSTASDVARLTGSLAGDDGEAWERALESYAGLERLSTEMRRVIGAYDRANTLLSGWNWIRWIYVDRKVFDDLGGVLERLRANLGRLDQLPQSS